MTINELRKEGLIAYEYVRGSWAHGIDNEGNIREYDDNKIIDISKI